MNSRLIIILSVFLIIILAAGCGSKYKTPADIKDKVAWLDSRSALPMFPFGTNPIYLYFTANWCTVSHQMNEDIFSRPEIIAYLNNNFTCISVILDSIDSVRFLGEFVTPLRFREIFKIEGYPVHYFFDDAGNFKKARFGYVELLPLKQTLKYLAEGYAEKMDFDTFMQLPASRLDTIYGEF